MTSLAVQKRRLRMLERSLLAFFLGLFIYAILEWRGIVGDGHPWQPERFLALSGGMLLQSIAGVVRERSITVFYSLLILSVTALGFSLVGY